MTDQPTAKAMLAERLALVPDTNTTALLIYAEANGSVAVFAPGMTMAGAAQLIEIGGRIRGPLPLPSTPAPIGDRIKALPLPLLIAVPALILALIAAVVVLSLA